VTFEERLWWFSVCNVRSNNTTEKLTVQSVALTVWRSCASENSPAVERLMCRRHAQEQQAIQVNKERMARGAKVRFSAAEKVPNDLIQMMTVHRVGTHLGDVVSRLFLF